MSRLYNEHDRTTAFTAFHSVSRSKSTMSIDCIQSRTLTFGGWHDIVYVKVDTPTAPRAAVTDKALTNEATKKMKNQTPALFDRRLRLMSKGVARLTVYY